MNIDKIIELVNKALDKLYVNDFILIKNNLYEINVVHRYAVYLEQLFNEINDIPNLSVDLEYNKNILSEKTYKSIIYDGVKYDIRPDLIIHERESNDNNILVIEFKKENNCSSLESDRRKLICLTSNTGLYKYRIGLLIILSKNKAKIRIEKYINGKRQ